MMRTAIGDIRQEFLNFFRQKKHKIVSGSSLVPDNDQSLLFTNSGMNQFKNIFLGINKPLFTRVATVQPCVRAGGKHNDLSHVGYTDRHLSFFEMLGNFSFGDYFKYEAIQFAWELLTDANWFNLSKEKLWVTVHVDDYESYNIWLKQVDIPNSHIISINNTHDIYDSDNFWQMGSTGPCGPCSEIFYDRGDQFRGALPGSSKECGERYVEIWNLVFIQFNRDMNSNLIPLSMLSVDTGMGLERITAILQGVDSNYSIDIFRNLISSISRIVKISNTAITNRSLCVIADHIRTCSFLIRDGVIPSNMGHGYVLRRIIRRAVLHGKILGVNDVFFYKLVSPLIENMKYITDVLCEKKDFIEKILFAEEELFNDTLKKGLALLQNQLKKLRGNILNGEAVFDLYDTYGFPLELIKDVCSKRDIYVDQVGFDALMLRQKKYSRKSNKFNISHEDISIYNMSSMFVGYKKNFCKAKVIALFQASKSVNKIHEKETGVVILNNTPFYGESGGQIGDSGELKTVSGLFQVIDTKKYKQTIAHLGIVNVGTINVGEEIFAQIDEHKRKSISFNHSATHLLRAALSKILEADVIQKGSLVNNTYLRFDFSHNEKLTDFQIHTVENIINKKIWDNIPVTVEVMSIETAKNSEIVIPKNKLYDKMVRVLKIGDFSTELCGGTHAVRTGEIGIFMITKECSIASGIRRIEAVTSDAALSIIYKNKVLLQNIFQSIQSDDKNVLSKVHELKIQRQNLRKEIEYLRNVQTMEQSLSFIKNIYYIKDVQVLIQQTKHVKSRTLLNTVDYLKRQLKSGVIVFINSDRNNKINLVVTVTQDLIQCNRINALDVIRFIADTFDGKGGGKNNIAQAGINKMSASKVSMEIDSLLHNVL